jgi:hypothetical protein
VPVEYNGAICSNSECKQPVSTVPGTPCPHCGSTSRTHLIHASDTLMVRGAMSWIHERKEVIRKRPWLRPLFAGLNLAALIGGFFIGQVEGAIIGLLLMVAGEIFVTKAIHQITRTHGQAH